MVRNLRNPAVAMGLPEFERGAEADGEGDGFCAGAVPACWKPPKSWGSNLDVAADDEGADANRAAELVRGDGHCGGAEFAEAERKLAGGLGGVGVERDFVRVADRGQLGDGLDDAGFVVGEHGDDEAGFGAEQLGSVAVRMTPIGSTGLWSMEWPVFARWSARVVMLGCSMGEVMRWGVGVLEAELELGGGDAPARRRSPKIARLLDSVPPLVKRMRSVGAAPRSSAMRSRAFSKTRRAWRPKECWLAGFR